MHKENGNYHSQGKFVSHFVILGLVMVVIVTGIYLFDLISNGWQWGTKLDHSSQLYLHASTMAFVTLVLIQIVNAFNARSAKQSIFRLKQNYYLWGATFISTLMIVLMVNLEWLREKIEIVQLSPKDWLIVILTSLSVLVFEEVRKLVENRSSNL